MLSQNLALQQQQVTQHKVTWKSPMSSKEYFISGNPPLRNRSKYPPLQPRSTHTPRLAPDVTLSIRISPRLQLQHLGLQPQTVHVSQTCPKYRRSYVEHPCSLTLTGLQLKGTFQLDGPRRLCSSPEPIWSFVGGAAIFALACKNLAGFPWQTRNSGATSKMRVTGCEASFPPVA